MANTQLIEQARRRREQADRFREILSEMDESDPAVALMLESAASLSAKPKHRIARAITTNHIARRVPEMRP